MKIYTALRVIVLYIAGVSGAGYIERLLVNFLVRKNYISLRGVIFQIPILRKNNYILDILG